MKSWKVLLLLRLAVIYSQGRCFSFFPPPANHLALYPSLIYFITLQSAKELLQRMDDCTVNVPELRLLRQYHTDAVLWISRFNDVLHNIHERHNQDSVVDELNCILEVGASLRIQGSWKAYIRIGVQNVHCLSFNYLPCIFFLVSFLNSWWVAFSSDWDKECLLSEKGPEGNFLLLFPCFW